MKLKKLPFLIFIFLYFYSFSSIAAMNPYNKDKTYDFDLNTPWLTSPLGIFKSGSHRKRDNNDFYHLIINTQRLLLRLARNENDISKTASRELSQFTVLDVMTDGIRLPQFTYCLNNRLNPSSFQAMEANTSIKNDICSINMVRGDFIIKLDKESSKAINKASQLQFILKLGKHLTNLNYDMNGFLSLSEKQESSVKSIKTETLSPKIITPSPLSKHTKTKKPKTCSAKAPAKYAKKIKPINYPCSDQSLKYKAQKNIKAKVKQLKKQEEAEAKRIKELEIKRIKEKEAQRKLEEQRIREELQRKQRELEFKKKKDAMWVARCQKHWKKNASPCFCRPYLNQAPKGTADTCKK